jgi:hypothetical protein
MKPERRPFQLSLRKALLWTAPSSAYRRFIQWYVRVDDVRPERPFQFSLRKLMLWTAVWSVYLEIVLWLGMWSLAAVGLTMYLVTNLTIYLTMGFPRGVRLLVPMTLVGILFLSSMMFFSLVACVIGVYPSWSFAALLLMWGGMCLLVAFLFLGGFLLVHAVISVGV